MTKELDKLPEGILEEWVRQFKGVWPTGQCERYYTFSEEHEDVYYGDYKEICNKLGWRMVYRDTLKDSTHLPQKIIKIGSKVQWCHSSRRGVVRGLYKNQAWIEDTYGEMCTVATNKLITLPTIEDEILELMETHYNGVDDNSDKGFIEKLLNTYNISHKEDK